MEERREIRLIKSCDILSVPECSWELKCCDEKIVCDSEIDNQNLVLSSRGISELPKNVILDNIVSISLEGNAFTELPLELCSLERLKFLNVAKNSIKVFPNELGDLRNLEYFNCSANSLETLPSSLSLATKLLILNSSRNNLNSIPDELKNLKRLEKLNLSFNKLENVPIALVIGSKFISHLDLSHNLLNDFSKEPMCSASLKILKVNNNRIKEVPVWMRCLESVEELYLGNNDFKCAPHHPLDDLMPLPCVTIARLSINACGLRNLPISLRHMKNLMYLDAGNGTHLCPTVDRNCNSVWDLSPSLTLSYLKELRLPYVGLSVLPDEFWRSLNKLEVLDLEGNNLMWLPDGLSCLNHLTELILSSNRLALLPGEIGVVKSIQELRLDKNKLHELPDEVGSLENLICLDLYENELIQFPLGISNFRNLEFLDLELNYFTIDELSNKVFKEIPADYEAMRENLRARFTHCNRFIGPKGPQSQDNFEEDYETLTLESDDQEEPQESFKNCEVAEEENWDVSDSSDDLFVPKHSQKDSVPHRSWHWARDNGRWEQPEEGDIFCPADIHPDMITRPSKDGPVTDEGQFDDVDDDS